jgi:glycosyltransferase involved in cell wall biosynthesis
MRLYQCLDRFSLKWLDFVVFVGAFTEQKVNVKLRCRTVINNGINIEECIDNLEVENKRISEALINPSFVIGAFGRLTSEKGFDVLIHAFKKVIHIVPDSKLIIWGDGYLKETLENLIKKEDLSDSVMLPGYTEHVAYYLKKIDVMVMSSHTEGLPIILLEAMKYKVPVLATEVGSISEVLAYGDCGFLVCPDDVKALADKIVYFYRHRTEGKQMVGRAYKRVDEVYSSRLMAKKYFNIYSSIL